MGTGTYGAMESAGVTLVRGDLRGVAQAIRLSRAAMRNIRQNLIFAFGYNTTGIPIAAGVLFPAFGLLLNPMIAAAGMSLSLDSVVANAQRLRRLHLNDGRPRRQESDEHTAEKNTEQRDDVRVGKVRVRTGGFEGGAKP